jgi:cobalt-zinc-cadmium efflux system outer membrane protein
MKFITYSITTLVLITFLIGCTSVPKDLGRSDVDTLVGERGLPVDTEAVQGNKDDFINSLLEKPLTAESAIRIALVNNPKLNASYAELGISAADVYEAGRIRNPVFHFSTLDSNEPGERNLTTYGLITSFTDLITLPSRKRFAKGEFSAMKQSVGAEVVNVAMQAEAAFYNFVASKQVYKLREQIAKAGGLSLGLAKRYHKAGNISPRELAMEYASASESKLACLEAEAEAYEKRTELATVLGLSVAADWDSPAQLPVPLEQEDEIDNLLSLAQQSRLDLAAAISRTDLLANRLGVTNWTRWLGDLDVGIEHERETEDVELTGPTIEWEIPIFSQNSDKKLRANAELQMAIAQVQHLKLDVENSVRLAHVATKNSKVRVNEYRNQLIPARIEAVERAQEEENFMLIGIFELIESKQEEYDAYQGYLEVVRDYWLARTALANAVGNTLPSSVNIGEEHLDVEEYIAPKSSGMDHSTHGGMDHSQHQSMEPSESETMDHSQHEGMKHSESETMDHSQHEGMKHSDHNMESDSNTPKPELKDELKNEHDAHSNH